MTEVIIGVEVGTNSRVTCVLDHPESRDCLGPND
jgi:hypothetical protein